MMILWLILQWAAITALLYLERMVGVPMLGLAWGLKWSINLRLPWKQLWLGWLWWMISVIYLLPFSLVAAMVTAGYLWMKYGQTVISSQLTRVIGVIILTGAVILLWQQQLTAATVVYLGVAPVVLILVTKLTRLRLGVAKNNS